jgi:cyclic pyranopterin phosphate synthase
MALFKLVPTPSSDPRPPIEPAEPWWTNSTMVTFSFKCNIACTFCMVEDVLDVYEGTTLESFRRFAGDPARVAGVKRIIFTGGEVTLAKNLLDYVAVARSLPSIQHVRLQTNAIRLGNRQLLRSFMEAGVDEYFVSLHAADASTGDAIAQRKGAFTSILRGLDAIREAGGTLITNTAIVVSNVSSLPAIVELAAPYGPRSMEFWNYWPRADEDGKRMLAARITDVQAPLWAAIEAAVAHQIPPVVKWFPRCLLGPHAWCQDDGQPPALIEDSYWSREPEYACLYEGVCALSVGRHADRARGKCAGLSDTYVHRFGWEEGVLRPVREGGGSVAGRGVADSLTTDAGPRRNEQAAAAQWLAGFGLRPREPIVGFELVRLGHAREGGGLHLTFQSGDDGIVVGIAPTDAARRCLTRTKSFDLFYQTNDARLTDRAVRLVHAVAERLALRDPGGLGLP